MHVFIFFGALAADDGHGHEHAGELAAFADPGTLWLTALFYALSVLPAVAILAIRGRAGLWIALVLGGLFTLLNLVDGVNHGVADGSWQGLVAVLLAVAIPGVLAFVENVRLLRAAPAKPAA